MNENYNLLEFFEKYKIIIPKLQRDYAQGRNDEKAKAIRDEFVSVLLGCLKEGKEIKLDFIYGEIKTIGDIKYFYPLDGQQRLTTLFLLYWYIAFQSNKLAEISERLSQFSYETRVSTREFCKNLTDSTKNMVNVAHEGKSVTEKIKDSSWFKSFWIRDPTIKSMLNMLETIEEKFGAIIDIKNDTNIKANPIVDNLKQNIISFDVIDLEDVGLSDDLYIKMNARGEELSYFEKFKAKFEKYLDDNKFEELISGKNKFSCKIDSVWTDLFWEYKDNYKIDHLFINFISRIAIINFAKSHIKSKAADDKIIKLHNSPYSLDTNHFENKDDFEYLKKVFDTYTKSDYRGDGKEVAFSTLFFPFKDFIKKEISYEKIIFFYAQTQYFLTHGPDNLDDTNFKDFMRVVRNILTNVDMSSPEQMRGATNLINELMVGSSDIYNFLANNKIKSNFASNQTEEERRKASLIIKDNSLKEHIFNAEDTDYCKGRITMLLNIAQNKDESFSRQRFEKTISFTKKYLNDKYIKSSILTRAMLTCDGEPYSYFSISYNLGNLSKYRFHDKRYFDNRSYVINEVQKQFELFISKLFTKMIDEDIDIELIINNFEKPYNMPNWRYRLIKEEALIETHNKIRIFSLSANNNVCYLYKNQRPKTINQCVSVE